MIAVVRRGLASEVIVAALACAVAGALALLVAVMGWRGSDLPAQLFRVELFRHDGFVLWDSQWFSGHPTLDYSVLSPVFGAVTGPLALCAGCGIASAFLFHRLVHGAFGASALVGSLWFATSMATNLVVGRVTFALGMTFMLGALLALQRRPEHDGTHLRVALPAREPGRRFVPRDRGRRVGLHARIATLDRVAGRGRRRLHRFS